MSIDSTSKGLTDTELRATPVPVSDGSSSLTVDNATISVVGGGAEATAQRVTIASDSTGVLSVDDNGGSLTVDGTVAATQSGTWNIGTVATITNVVPVSDNSSSLTVDNATISVVGSGTEATAQRVTIASDSTGVLSVDDNGGSLTVDGSVTVSATNLDIRDLTSTDVVTVVQGTATSLKTQAENYQGGTAVGSGNPLQVSLANHAANSTAVKVDGSSVTQPVSGTVTANAGTGTLAVSLASVPSHAVTNAGTFAVQVTSAPSTAVTNAGTFATQATSSGVAAHDAPSSGNPVLLGGHAVSAEPTAVTAADAARLITDLVGKLIVLPYANPENFVSGAITTAMTGTTSTSLVAAPAAGLRNYITQITISNAHATVGTDVVIQDGNGGTTLYTIPAAAVYGGATLSFPTPLRQPTTATALYCANVTTGASTKVSASGYKGA